MSRAWAYQVGSQHSEITGPDNGLTAHDYGTRSLVGSWDKGLVYKTVSPLLGTTWRCWQKNEPWLGVNALEDPRNPFVSTEYRKLPDGSGRIAATKFDYDKNGNPLSRTAYDWVASPGDYPALNCAPSGSVLRRTEQRYWHPVGGAGAVLNAASPPASGLERKQLESVLSLFGEPNEKNAVFVGFGYAKGAVGLEWKEGNRVNMRLDLDLFDKSVAGWARSDSRVQPDVEFTGIVAHEGTHANDVYLFGNDYMLMRGRIAAETSAFGAQSFVNKSFNTLSPYGLWNPSWARVDTAKQERWRSEAVRRNAEDAARRGQGLR